MDADGTGVVDAEQRLSLKDDKDGDGSEEIHSDDLDEDLKDESNEDETEDESNEGEEDLEDECDEDETEHESNEGEEDEEDEEDGEDEEDVEDEDDEEDDKDNMQSPSGTRGVNKVDIPIQKLVDRIDTSLSLNENLVTIEQLQDAAWDEVILNKRDSVQRYIQANIAKEDFTQLIPTSALRVLKNMAGCFRKSTAAREQMEKDRQVELTLNDEEGHVLVYTRYTPRIAQGYFCDWCSIVYPSGPTYSCEECDFDICIKCYSKRHREIDEKYLKLQGIANPKYDKWKPLQDGFNRFTNESMVKETLLIYWSALTRRLQVQNQNASTEVSCLACLLWQTIAEGIVAFDCQTALTETLGFDAINSLVDYALRLNEPELFDSVCGLLSILLARSHSVQNDCFAKAQTLVFQCLEACPYNDDVAEEAFQLMIVIGQSSKSQLSVVDGISKAARVRFTARQ